MCESSSWHQISKSPRQPNHLRTIRSVFPGVLSLRPRGAPELRTPGVRPLARAPSHPSSGRRARGAPLQSLAALRTGRRPSVEGGRAAAGLGLGRRKPQRQQSLGGEVGEGESRTPARPDPDLRWSFPPLPQTPATRGAPPSRRCGRDPTGPHGTPRSLPFPAALVPTALISPDP